MKDPSRHKMQIVAHYYGRKSKGQLVPTPTAPAIQQPVETLKFVPQQDREELLHALAALASGDRAAFADLTGMYLCAVPGSALHRQVAAFMTANSLPLSPTATPDDVVRAASVAARAFLRELSAGTASAAATPSSALDKREQILKK